VRSLNLVVRRLVFIAEKKNGWISAHLEGRGRAWTAALSTGLHRYRQPRLASLRRTVVAALPAGRDPRSKTGIDKVQTVRLDGLRSMAFRPFRLAGLGHLAPFLQLLCHQMVNQVVQFAPLRQRRHDPTARLGKGPSFKAPKNQKGAEAMFSVGAHIGRCMNLTSSPNLALQRAAGHIKCSAAGGRAQSAHERWRARVLSRRRAVAELIS
jgi:hypothetical protein